jgi:hypothetical protein
MVRGFLALLIGALLATGCADGTSDPQPPAGPAREAAVLTAVITSVAELPTEPGVLPGVLPVVYAVGVQGTIDIGVQASVAASLMEVCDLRFADDPAEAFEEIDGVVQVREGAVLLVIGTVPLEGDELGVAVLRQSSDQDKEELTVTVVLRDLEWLVTKVTTTERVA